jgi:hypothetical protein
MNKRVHISILLLLSFSILLSHNLVPHHHHAELVEHAIDDDCPLEHNDHQCDEEAPVHCHAFNDLTFYKVSGQDVIQKVKIISTAAILIAEHLIEDPDAVVTCRIISIEVPPALPGIYSSISRRGPPSFV